MKRQLKRYLKITIAGLLYYTGVLSLLKRYKLRKRAVVLMYHRVLPQDQRQCSYSHDAIIVDIDNFEKQLRFLSRHFNILSPDDFIDHFESRKPLPNSSCLITFDDAWQDNYEHAWPRLKRFNVPALIFAPTDYIDSGKLFWQEALGHGLRQCLASDSPRAIALLKEHRLHRLKSSSEHDKRASINSYVRTLKTLDYDEIKSMLALITDIVGPLDFGRADRYLGSSQLQSMHNKSINFGSHACSHSILTRLDEQQIQVELEKSKALLEETLATTVRTIAYPNGNYDSRVCELARKAGYSLGFTTEFGSVSIDDNPYRIRRVNINDSIGTSMPVLLAAVLGVFN